MNRRRTKKLYQLVEIMPDGSRVVRRISHDQHALGHVALEFERQGFRCVIEERPPEGED